MRKLRPREGQGCNKPKGSQPKGEAASQPHICPTPNSMFLIWLGGSWALGDRTLPLSRRTRNGKQGAVENRCYGLAQVRGESWVGISDMVQGVAKTTGTVVV